VGQETLSRFYVLHVVVLPLVTAILVAVHFWRVRKDGGICRPKTTSVRQGLKHRETETPAMVEQDDPSTESTEILTWPTAIWAQGAVALGTLAFVIVLALAWDAPLKEMANPVVPENPAKSPWFLLGIQELVSYSAVMGGVLLPGFLAGLFVLLPFLDREQEGLGVWFAGREGLILTSRSSALTLAASILLLSINVQWGWIHQWQPGTYQWLLMVFNPGTVLLVLISSWTAFVLKKTGSTRMAALAWVTCVLTGFVVFTLMGLWFRGPNWEFYWWPGRWPVV
jgi:quinol-cytochrome oxidoreductase complex cytochrome b subunit